MPLKVLPLTGFIALLAASALAESVTVRTDRELGAALVKASNGTVIHLAGDRYGSISITDRFVRINGATYGRSRRGTATVELTGKRRQSPPVLGAIERQVAPSGS
ncbi:MAG: hypothetical protein AAGA03_02560 [Planctomycetota bacterium]